MSDAFKILKQQNLSNIDEDKTLQRPIQLYKKLQINHYKDNHLSPRAINNHNQRWELGCLDRLISINTQVLDKANDDEEFHNSHTSVDSDSKHDDELDDNDEIDDDSDVYKKTTQQINC